MAQLYDRYDDDDDDDDDENITSNTLRVSTRLFSTYMQQTYNMIIKNTFNPLNAELNPICHLLALLGTHHILHVSRIRVKW